MSVVLVFLKKKIFTFSSKSDNSGSRTTMNDVGEYDTVNMLLTANLSELLKDTVNDTASLNGSVLGKVELDKLSKTT